MMRRNAWAENEELEVIYEATKIPRGVTLRDLLDDFADAIDREKYMPVATAKPNTPTAEKVVFVKRLALVGTYRRKEQSLPQDDLLRLALIGLLGGRKQLRDQQRHKQKLDGKRAANREPMATLLTD